MKKLSFTIALLSCLMFFIGCKESPVTPVEPDGPDNTQKLIPIHIAMSVWTKANDYVFESGDEVGLYVSNYDGETATDLLVSGNHADNIRFTYNSSWKSETPLYWKDQNTKADFYCYYPYCGNVFSIDAFPVSVGANQSNADDYWASDFLWGKTSGVDPTPNAVNITVKHLMSNLIIHLAAGEGYKDEDLSNAEVTICGLKTQATVNLATGAVTPEGDVVDMQPMSENGYFRALVVPQSVNDSELVKIRIGDNEYTFKQTITFESNKQHSCTITVSKTGEGINIGIGGWVEDENDYGGEVK